jgi:hypothetical protein
VTEKIPKYASIKDSTPKNEEVGLTPPQNFHAEILLYVSFNGGSFGCV